MCAMNMCASFSLFEFYGKSSYDVDCKSQIAHCCVMYTARNITCYVFMHMKIAGLMKICVSNVSYLLLQIILMSFLLNNFLLN